MHSLAVIQEVAFDCVATRMDIFTELWVLSLQFTVVLAFSQCQKKDSQITLPRLKSIFERNRKKVLPLILRKTHYSQPPFTEFWYVLFVMYYLSGASVLHA